MPYTWEDAKKEVGKSVDWEVGRIASIKKWRQIVQEMEDAIASDISVGASAVLSYDPQEKCGFCFVARNQCDYDDGYESQVHYLEVCDDCIAEEICRAIQAGAGLELAGAKRALRDLEQELKDY